MRVWRRVSARVAWRAVAYTTHAVTPSTSSSLHVEAPLREQAIEAVSSEVFAAGNLRMRSADTLAVLPEGVLSFPEVCFIGKPNVGKSAIVSCLLHNRKMALSGRRGGTTRLLNFYNVGDALLLVDTPGYGSWAGRPLSSYAAKQANAFAILFRYLALRKHANLRRVYWVMEANARGPMQLQPRDVELRDFLSRERIAYTVLLTKIDRHWRTCVERQRRTLRMRHDGAPVPPRPAPRARGDSATPRGGGGDDATALAAAVEGGIARNIHEIQSFLRSHREHTNNNNNGNSGNGNSGDDDVPILAVCALRNAPRRCYNLTRLQHDIVRHCCAELPRAADVTVAKLRALRYAPPLADDVERVQLRYPIESFVVPDDDNMTLAAMVRRHEEAKARYVARHCPHLLPQLLLSPRDALAQRAEQALLDTACTSPPHAPAAVAALGDADDDATRTPLLPSSTTATTTTTTTTTTATTTTATTTTTTTAATSRHVDSGSGVLEARRSDVATTATRVPWPLPFALDNHAPGVCAINGVCLPRSLIPASVRALAASKPDEKASFALQYSGAGAYEALLRRDYASHNNVDDVLVDGSGSTAAVRSAPLLFTECNAAARLPAHVLDASGAPRRHSAAWRRQQRLLLKYVARRRKPRSVQLQAQSYLCPWLASAGQPHRNAVVGLSAAAAAYVPGRGGARLQGRRASGFGGRSHSAGTLRQHGRATNKVGFWAA